MNSRRSLDNGRIGILGHDQLKQDLEFFVAGYGAVVLIIGSIRFGERRKLSDNFFH
jgi:hypothetical protein